MSRNQHACTLLFVIVLTIFFAIRPVGAESVNIIVNSSADTTGNDGVCTLREAIINANNDSQSGGSVDCPAGSGTDTITFASGLNNATITLTGGEIIITDHLIINGLGETQLTISGNDNSRIFNADDSALTVTDVTLTNGNITHANFARGGCILATQPFGVPLALTLTNVTIQNCVLDATDDSAYGGAIATDHDTLNFTNVTLHNNQALSSGNGSGLGGALWVEADATLTFNAVTVTNNVVQADNLVRGGAIYVREDVVWNWASGLVAGNSAESLEDSAYGGGLSVFDGLNANFTDVTIDNNQLIGGIGAGTTHSSGGGISATGTLVADNLVVTNNTISSHDNDFDNLLRGGGISMGGEVTLSNSLIQGNSTADPSNLGVRSTGGGMLMGVGDLTLNNTQIISNTAREGGGIDYQALSCSGGFTQLTLSGGTFDDNFAYDVGGALSVKGSGVTVCPVILENVTVTDNRAHSGGGVHLTGGEIIIDNSTISGNRATVLGGGISTALFTVSGDIRNTQITQNVAEASGDGGGIHVGRLATITLDATSAVTSNTAGEFGGGVYNDGQLLLDGGSINSNDALSGGGVYVDQNGTLTATGGSISHNDATDGGGVFAINQVILQDGATVSGNDATLGAGVYLHRLVSGQIGRLTTHNAHIDDNTSTGSGAGIYNDGFANLNGGTVSDNTAGGSGSGGGMALVEGTATISGVTFDANQASFFGGGVVSLVATDAFSITHSTFSNNIAASGGGIYYILGTSAFVANSTFSGNDVGSQASGIYANADLTLTNVTVANGIGDSGVVQAGAGVLTLENSIVANNAGDECDGTITTNGLPNLATDATCNALIVNANPGLGVLQNNGGTTDTHALLVASPAIDSGDDATCNAFPVSGVDQRGAPRPNGVRCDLGAYEFGAVPTAVTLQGVSAESAPSPLRLILPAMVLVAVFGLLWLRRGQ